MRGGRVRLRTGGVKTTKMKPVRLTCNDSSPDGTLLLELGLVAVRFMIRSPAVVEFLHWLVFTVYCQIGVTTLPDTQREQLTLTTAKTGE